jgi:hypothetical protein
MNKRPYDFRSIALLVLSTALPVAQLNAMHNPINTTPQQELELEDVR